MKLPSNILSTPFRVLLLACFFAGLAVAPSQAWYIGIGNANGPASAEFTYLGTPTKWDPGPNTARFHGFAAPAGPMAPGGA